MKFNVTNFLVVVEDVTPIDTLELVEIAVVVDLSGTAVVVGIAVEVEFTGMVVVLAVLVVEFTGTAVVVELIRITVVTWP